MKQLHSIERRKRSFFTWLLIFILVFDSLPLDVLAADIDYDTFWNEGSFSFDQTIVKPGDTVSSSYAEADPYKAYYFVGDNPDNPKECHTVSFNKVGTVGTRQSFVVGKPSELGFTTISDSDLYGWWLSVKDGSGKAISEFGLQAILNCKVTFDPNGHGNTPDPQTVSQGSLITEPSPYPASEVEGYDFGGWFTESECTNQFIFSSAVTQSMTLYAKWTPKNYTITWKNGDIVLSTNQVPYNTVPVYGGETPAKASTVSRNYTFSGWDPQVVAATEDKTYYAQFAETPVIYDITWKNDDGSTIDTTQVAYGDTPSHADPTKAATDEYTYTFSKWTPDIVPVTGDATYTASYNSAKNKYTITWKDGDDETLKSESLDYGVIPAYSGATPTKTATAQYTYTFNNTWTPAIVPVSGNKTYTASFNATLRSYSVSFNKNGHGTGNAPATQTKDYGQKADQPSPMSDPYYDFGGWYKEAACTNAWNFASDTVTGDVTLYAKWTPKVFTVSYNANGHGTAPASEKVTYGNKAAKPADPTDTHYDFGGWYREAKCDTAWDFANDTISSDMILYAKWSPKKYTVSFDNNGHGSEAPASQSVAYNDKAVKPVDPTDEHYEFVAWYKEAGCTTQWNFATDTVSGDTILYAKWSPKKYTVSFNNSGIGTVTPPSQSVSYNELASKPADLTEEHHIFGGWYKEAACTNAWDFNSDRVFGDMTLYAKWTSKTYTVSWNNYDGSLLEKDTGVAYGSTPSYDGDTPVKPSTVSQNFTHDGWTPAITTVSGDIVYTAVFAASPRTYTISWNNYDDSTITTTQAAYGETPVYTGATPAKPSTAQYSYSFNGWAPAIVPVVADATYTAQYTETLRTYTVTWKNSDGSIIETDTGVAYGAMPSYDGATPTQAEDVANTYSFTGWSPAVAAVTGDVTYYATYTNTPKQYTVTFVDEDGSTVLKGPDAYNYGTNASSIAKPADPKKEPTAQYSYEFGGWSPALADVTADAVYKATYIEVLRTYDITWKNDDGSVLKTDKAAYGSMPEYNGDTPFKRSTAQYDYSFDGWTPEIVSVTGDAEYTAVYKEILRKYDISWKDYDGTLLESDKVAYGDMPVYTGQTPERSSTESTKYSFKGWTPEIVSVTGDAEYTAEYDESPVQYSIKFVDEDGVTVLKAAVEYDYGTPASKIKTPGTPYKAPDDDNEYSFAGWSPSLSRVTKDQTYKAVYNSIPIEKKAPESKDEDKDEPVRPASVPPITTAAPADAVKSPQTGEDNRRAILIGASAFSISVLLLGSLLTKRKKRK